MVKQSQKVIDRQSLALALKPKSVTIHKQVDTRSAKKSTERQSCKYLDTNASTASLGQSEGDRQD